MKEQQLGNYNPEASEEPREEQEEEPIGEVIIPDDPIVLRAWSLFVMIWMNRNTASIFLKYPVRRILGNDNQGWIGRMTVQQPMLCRSKCDSCNIFSWYQAVLCQNNIVLSLFNARWKDACDGIIEQWTNFPYGNTWVENYCAARLGESEQVYDEYNRREHLECEALLEPMIK